MGNHSGASGRLRAAFVPELPRDLGRRIARLHVPTQSIGTRGPLQGAVQVTLSRLIKHGLERSQNALAHVGGRLHKG